MTTEGHELALQKGLVQRLKADAMLAALVEGRVWDHVPEGAAYPHVRLGRRETRSLPAGGDALEHRLSLIVVSRFPGMEEAQAVAAAVRLCLSGAVIATDGMRSLALAPPASEVFASGDGDTTWAVLRLRVVTRDED